MCNKERIAVNIKWDVDELDAVMHLCDLSDTDCAYALNVDVYKFSRETHTYETDISWTRKSR
jgi:hypothetical protein